MAHRASAVRWIGNAALVVVSILLTLFALELACRLWKGPEWLVRWPNIVLANEAGFAREMREQLVHDPSLGYAPRPDYRSAGINHDQLGTRSTPGSNGPTDGLVLAVGDSNTYGDEVTDAESWPALLEALTGHEVVNGGVIGYGLDQTVLRAEQLVPIVRPSAMIVSFIDDNLLRSEWRRLWGKGKPFFVPTDEGLELHNVPVSTVGAPAPSFWQRAFGWSALAELAARRLGRGDEWSGASVRAVPEGSGERIGCLLMRRLARLDVPTLVVAQYAPGSWRHPPAARHERPRSQRILDCAIRAGLATFDTFDLVDTATRERGVDAMWMRLHPTPEGNRLIARAIAAELERRQIIGSWRRPRTP